MSDAAALVFGAGNFPCLSAAFHKSGLQASGFFARRVQFYDVVSFYMNWLMRKDLRV